MRQKEKEATADQRTLFLFDMGRGPNQRLTDLQVIARLSASENATLSLDYHVFFVSRSNSNTIPEQGITGGNENTVGYYRL